jgi:transposase
MTRFMRQQLPTVVVMEACYSSHYWGREIAKLGHDTKLIPAQHVTLLCEATRMTTTMPLP